MGSYPSRTLLGGSGEYFLEVQFRSAESDRDMNSMTFYAESLSISKDKKNFVVEYINNEGILARFELPIALYRISRLEVVESF